MALTASGSVLVAGGAMDFQEGTQVKMRSVKVVRAFFWSGKATEVGAVVEVPVVFAAELIAARKAIAYDPPPAATQQEPDAAPAVHDKESPRATKEVRHAR